MSLNVSMHRPIRARYETNRSSIVDNYSYVSILDKEEGEITLFIHHPNHAAAAQAIADAINKQELKKEPAADDLNGPEVTSTRMTVQEGEERYGVERYDAPRVEEQD
jgi:hypothetical protein